MRSIPCRLAVVLGSILALSACASAPSGKPLTFTPAAAEAPGEFKAAGTLISWGNSVSYDGHRIVGPQVDIQLQNGNEWAGSVYGRTIRLTSAGGALEGMGDKLVFTRDGDTVRVEGRWSYRRVRIEVAQTHLVFRDGQRAFDLTAKGPGCLGDYRPGCIVKAIGDATKLTDAMMPQFALSLLAAFPFEQDR